MNLKNSRNTQRISGEMMKTTIAQFLQEHKIRIFITQCQICFNFVLSILMFGGLVPFVDAVPTSAIPFGVWTGSFIISGTLMMLGIFTQKVKVINFTLLLGVFFTVAILGMPLYS